MLGLLIIAIKCFRVSISTSINSKFNDYEYFSYILDTYVPCVASKTILFCIKFLEIL